MTTSTTRDKNTRLSPALRLGAVAVWLLLWQLASMAVGLPLLLPSPLAVLLRLRQLCTGADFWLTVASSLLRILLGFLLFGESITLRQFIGAAVIIVGIVLFVRADNEGEGGQ